MHCAPQLHGCRPWLCFFFYAPATTEIYTLSLHDALPIYKRPGRAAGTAASACISPSLSCRAVYRSEEHTSELQSPVHIVGPLLLEKKNVREPVPSWFQGPAPVLSAPGARRNL